jgi:SAM-dependent methyltransferase
LGIASQIARLLLREHRYRSITGELLVIGKQTVELSAAQALSVVDTELGAPSDVIVSDVETDASTRAGMNKDYITDRGFFELFSDAKYCCLDQSSYEGAGIVFNLCDPEFPQELEGRFDFIFDGSSLDNIFDPAMAVRHLARALRPGGRIFHVNRTARMHSDYLAFSLSWFHDFYSINDFQDCQVYLAQREIDDTRRRWDIYRYMPVLERDGQLKFFGQDQYFFQWRHGHCVVIAEKGANSTWKISPIQYQYRPTVPNAVINRSYETLDQEVREFATDPYVKAAVRFSRSGRPCWLRPDEKVELPPDRLHYAPRISYCGSLESI